MIEVELNILIKPIDLIVHVWRFVNTKLYHDTDSSDSN